MAKDGRRSYTDAEREAALRLYTELGAAEASRKLDVPAATIRSWAVRTGATSGRRANATANVEAARRTWAQRKAEVAMAAGEAAAEAVAAIREEIEARQPRRAADLSRAFAVVVDKAQLLDGGATGQLEPSESELRAQVTRLRDELAAEHGDELADKRAERQAAGA